LSYSFKKLLLFEIPYSIFYIQNAKHAKAIRLKGEGFKPGEWKNKKAEQSYGEVVDANRLSQLIIKTDKIVTF